MEVKLKPIEAQKNEQFSALKESEKTEFSQNLSADMRMHDGEQQQMNETSLKTAERKIEENMPPQFAGKYKEPKETFSQANPGINVMTHVQKNELGQASLHMKDSKLSQIKNTGGAQQQIPEKPITEEDVAIRKVMQNMFKISSSYLLSRMSGWSKGEASPHDLTITIRATNCLSTVTEKASNYINEWVKEQFPEHPEYAKYVKFDLIKLNPAINHPDNKYDLSKNTKAESANTTVIYSAKTKSKDGIQSVRGADRFVLTENEDDTSALFSKTLPEQMNGMFFYNKKGEFESVKSFSEAQKKLDNIKGIPVARKKALLEIAQEFFDDHSINVDLADAEKTEEKKPGDKPSGSGNGGKDGGNDPENDGNVKE